MSYAPILTKLPSLGVGRAGLNLKLLGPLQVLVWKAMAGLGAGLWLVTCLFLMLSSILHHRRPATCRCGHFRPDASLSSIYTFPLQQRDDPNPLQSITDLILLPFALLCN